MMVIKLKDTNIVFFFLFQNMVLDFKSHCYFLKYNALSVMRKNVTLRILAFVRLT